MTRLMSVALTEDAVRARRKTVTRRLGWHMLKSGDHLTLCRKVMGRRKDEPLVRICEVEVVDVRRERLSALDEWVASDFVEFFCEHMKCKPETEVTRIEWRYL